MMNSLLNSLISWVDPTYTKVYYTEEMLETLEDISLKLFKNDFKCFESAVLAAVMVGLPMIEKISNPPKNARFIESGMPIDLFNDIQQLERKYKASRSAIMYSALICGIEDWQRTGGK